MLRERAGGLRTVILVGRVLLDPPSSPKTIECEQIVIAVPIAAVHLEEQLRGEEPERHAVSAVTEREEVARIAPMRADVGKAVGRGREETLPRVLEPNAREWGIACGEECAD